MRTVHFFFLRPIVALEHSMIAPPCCHSHGVKRPKNLLEIGKHSWRFLAFAPSDIRPTNRVSYRSE